MKGVRRGANCTERRGIDVVENEPIDLRRENVEIETVNLTVLTNSLTAANLHNIISILSFVLFPYCLRCKPGAHWYFLGGSKALEKWYRLVLFSLMTDAVFPWSIVRGLSDCSSSHCCPGLQQSHRSSMCNCQLINHLRRRSWRSSSRPYTETYGE